MKRYIAQKAMKFDKSYPKGAEIPQNVIAKDMLNKLVRCGALAVEQTTEQDRNLEETEQTKTLQNKKSKKVDVV